MKTSTIEKDIGGTAASINILMIDTKRCVQMMSNDTYFSGSCFSGVKMSWGAMAEGVYYCGPVKTRHKVFCIDTL